MRYLPFCPEHGLRIHTNGFVYYNGPFDSNLLTATKRNLLFNGEYYIANFFKKGNKMESGRLCYENSEDAVSYNVFTELLSNGLALNKLASQIINEDIKDKVDLYLWGGKIDLKNNKFTPYAPLLDVRKHLESDIKRFATEPDIMLVVPNKVIICIEAKFGSKNSIAKEKEDVEGEKPKAADRSITRYCTHNKLIDTNSIFDFSDMPNPFYEQLFRNIVFAASMAHLEGAKRWYVVNLRNRHAMNLKRGEPESMPVMRNVRSMLKAEYKKRFTHLTWEDIYEQIVKDNRELDNLGWYLKNKSLGCSRAFNIF